MILNNDVILILGCVAFALVLVLIGVVIAKNKEIVTCKSKMEILDAQNRELSIYNARLEAELHAQKEGNSALKSDLDEQGKKLELKLNAIMEQHLEQKLQKLDTVSTKSLETLLKPFKENLDTFKKSVENSQESSI